MGPAPDDTETKAGDALRGRVSDARPALDPIVLAVMRANAVGALFGARPTVRIGRYELLRELGTGGGGSVFVARDPELDREIAIKLISAPDPALRARALAEGQLLARLSHPNIVPVFDVGVADDRVYLVMELIRGASLRGLADRASVREVVRAYRQAGEGLVAAHGAGLVHRDFKPDNAMLGADGRVRVIDFGLAGAEGVSGRGGTPRYIAPEQRAGAAATPVVDQYAFASALAEGVARAGGGTVPRWLEPIVRRGSNADPAARYPSLAALLRALANDPRRRWSRRALIAVPVTLAIAGFAAGRRGEPAQAACDDGAVAIAPEWTPGRERAAHDHVARLATPFAISSAPRARDQLAGYARRWIEARDQACVAARTEPSTTVIERRAACLATAKNQLGAMVDVLSAVDADGLPGALRAVSELPDLGTCGDPAALISELPVPTPAQAPLAAAIQVAIDRAQVLADAARPDAAAAAVATVDGARSLGYRPLLAAALLLHGRALYVLDQRVAAIAPLEEAVELAISLRDDRRAVEAFAHLMLAKKVRIKPALILAELRPIRALASRLGPRDRFARALLHTHAGVLELSEGNRERARAEHLKALALARQVTGPGAVELIWVRTNLAIVTDDQVERRRLNAESVAVARDRLGGDHPLTLKLAIAEGLGLVELTTARDVAHPAFVRFAALHPTQSRSLLEYGYELAIIELATGDHAAARAVLDIIARVPETEPHAMRHAIARAYKRFLDGDAAGARAAFDQLAIATAPPVDAPWHTLTIPADVELGRALVAAVATQRRAAVARAITYLERAGARVVGVARRLSWARALAEPP